MDATDLGAGTHQRNFYARLLHSTDSSIALRKWIFQFYSVSRKLLLCERVDCSLHRYWLCLFRANWNSQSTLAVSYGRQLDRGLLDNFRGINFVAYPKTIAGIPRRKRKIHNSRTVPKTLWNKFWAQVVSAVKIVTDWRAWDTETTIKNCRARSVAKSNARETTTFF